MVEQTQSDSTPMTMEERVEAQLFGDDADTAEEHGDEQSDEQVAEESDESEAAPAEAELETVEYEGKEYRVPPELKAAVMRNADYTTKTQEVAEMRRSAQSQAETLRMQSEFEKAVAQDMQSVHAIEAQMKQYKELDWTGLDAEALFKLQRAYENLKDSKADAEKSIADKRKQFDGYVQQQFAAQVQATEAYMAKAVPGWSAKAGRDLTGYMAAQGLGPAAIKEVVKDPVATLAYWKAQQFDKAKSGAKPDKAKTPTVKPGASSPDLSKRMQTLNFKKQLSAAKTPRGKADLIQKRLENMV